MGMKREGANYLHPDYTVLKDNSLTVRCETWKVSFAEFTFVRQSSI